MVTQKKKSFITSVYLFLAREFDKKVVPSTGGGWGEISTGMDLLRSELDTGNWGDVVDAEVAADVARRAEMQMLDMTSRDGINLLFKQARSVAQIGAISYFTLLYSLQA